MSFLQVSVFPGRQLGDYVLNHVARTKILVAMAPKVVTAWRVEHLLIGFSLIFHLCASQRNVFSVLTVD